MSTHTDPRAHLAAALRAHQNNRMAAILQAARDPRVRTGFMDPENPSTWIQYATPEKFMAAHGQIRGIEVGTGKTTAFRDCLHRLVDETTPNTNDGSSNDG